MLQKMARKVGNCSCNYTNNNQLFLLNSDRQRTVAFYPPFLCGYLAGNFVSSVTAISKERRQENKQISVPAGRR